MNLCYYRFYTHRVYARSSYFLFLQRNVAHSDKYVALTFQSIVKTAAVYENRSNIARILKGLNTISENASRALFRPDQGDRTRRIQEIDESENADNLDNEMTADETAPNLCASQTPPRRLTRMPHLRVH